MLAVRFLLTRLSSPQLSRSSPLVGLSRLQAADSGLILLGLGLIICVFAHFFEALGVGGADEVGLHVVDPALGIHEVLILLALNLDHAHDDAINHVNRLALFVLAFALTLTPFLVVLDALPVLLHVVLNSLALFRDRFLVFTFVLILHILVVVGHTVGNLAHCNARLEVNVIKAVFVAGPAIFISVLGLEVVWHSLQLLLLLRVLPEVLQLITE